MSVALGKKRQPGPALPAMPESAANVSNILAQLLGQYIPGYSIITEFTRTRLGIDPDKIVAILGFIFGGWALINYIQNIVLPRILGSFTSSLILDRNDSTYEDFTSWISKRRIFQYARSIRIVGRQGEHKPLYHNPWNPFMRGETFLSQSMEQDYSYAEEQDENELFDFAALEAKRPLLFEPQAGNYWFYYKRNIFLFSKGEQTVASTSGRNGSSSSTVATNITLTCIGLSTKPLKDLMETARSETYEDQAFRTSIFRPGGMTRFDRFNSGPSPWMKVASRPSRPLESVVLSRDQKEQILKDWNSFLHPKRQAWFAARGIPYRRGYLFSGPPGTGKTSICYALAGVFGVDVFVVALGDNALGDGDLTGLLTDLPTRCIVVLEDIDCIGSQRSDEDEKDRELTNMGYAGYANKMSLSGLLNAIDGVGAHEGHILVMTTNHPNVLDDALKRPGRIDMHVEFSLASRKQIQEIFIRMFSVSDTQESKAGRRKRNMTVESACRESSQLTSERSCPYMSTDELLKAAKGFADNFGDETFSPAEIQGFLLKHKSSPTEALSGVVDWIPAQLAARDKAAQEAEKAKERKATRKAELLAQKDAMVEQNNARMAQGLPPMPVPPGMSSPMGMMAGGGGGRRRKGERGRHDMPFAPIAPSSGGSWVSGTDGGDLDGTAKDTDEEKKANDENEKGADDEKTSTGENEKDADEAKKSASQPSAEGDASKGTQTDLGHSLDNPQQALQASGAGNVGGESDSPGKQDKPSSSKREDSAKTGEDYRSNAEPESI